MLLYCFFLLSLLSPLHAAAAWVCPMHCEGTKSYSAPGKCPVCGMGLEEAGQPAPVPLNSHDYRVEVVLQPKPPLSGQIAQVTLIPKSTHDGSDIRLFSAAARGTLFSEDRVLVERLPESFPKDGHYRAQIKFPGAGNYLLYYEFTPDKGTRQVFPLTVHVEGAAGKPVAHLRQQNSTHEIKVKVAGATGECVLLSEDTTYFARVPIKNKTCSTSVTRKGNYRLWYQAKHGEEAVDLVVN